MVMLALAAVCWSASSRAGQRFNLDFVVSSLPGGTNYDVFVSVFTYSNADDTVADPDLSGLLQTVTSGSNTIPFVTAAVTPLLQIYSIELQTTADSLFQDFTLTWPNATVPYHLDFGPLFALQPQSQSAFLGSTVVFTAQAVHTTGYQWQKDGTNLVADGHFNGVTDGTLVISNVQPADAGSYALVVNNPKTAGVSVGATLSVYKPMQLELVPSSTPAGFELQLANQDGSPFEDARIPKLSVFSTTNLALTGDTWNLETNAIVSSNGVLHVFFPTDGNSSKFWRVQEQ